MQTIVVDLLGSDSGSEALAAGVRLALEKRSDFRVVLVGPATASAPVRAAFPARVDLLETDTFISNAEHPVIALRHKKDASLVLGLQRLNELKEGAFVSAGSTGAILAGSYFITRRIPGMERAGLGVQIPDANGGCLLIDAGANTDTTPAMQLHFAYMGVAYMEKVLHRENPRVGLLNVGAESEKGEKRAQETHALLADAPLHFVGNIEGRDLLAGRCDVLVSDGFTGNVALKSIEGTASTLFHLLKEGIYSSFMHKLGGALLKDVFSQIASTYNYKAHGGAPLLGVRRPIYKAHGNSSLETFALAISEAVDFAASGVTESLQARLQQENGGRNEQTGN